MKRCAWAVTPLLAEYHDREWGVPVHDDRVLFEFITLEGAQAGLNWETILRKREAYHAAFANFDPAKVARFTAARRARLMRDPGIVRNRLKIDSTVSNAAAFLEVQREFGSFDRFLGDSSKASGARGSRIPSARNSSVVASVSSARRSVTRSCRRSAS